MKELYGRDITEPSLKELEEFALWYNEKLGNYPILVGGWAVYCYTKGLGSKDIDVVFLGDKAKHVTLFDYFRSHGYSERTRTFFDKEFVKIVKNKNNEVEIIIDAVSSNRIIIFEGRKTRLSWDLAVRNSVKHKIGDATVYIPTLELLLTYKLGAILGRNINLRTGLDTNYYRSKLWKDVYDVISLSKFEMNAGTVHNFLPRSKLYDYRSEIMTAIEDNYDDEIRSLLNDTSLIKIRKLLGADGDKL